MAHHKTILNLKPKSGKTIQIDDNIDGKTGYNVNIESEYERAIDIKLTIPKTDPEITKPIVYDSKKPLMSTVSEALNSFGI